MAALKASSFPSSDDSVAATNCTWNSDAIVEQLSRLGLRYTALVPGSSYRGVHDSLVNYNGSRGPEMIMCLHEEHCVAIAHGFAKITEYPMVAAVHANVGLMHATMAVYNAFCDRVPVVILGATGPVDAAKRRPWIDWIHTSTDQASLIRPFIKFDDQPSSVDAAITSLIRATAMAAQIPRAPVYVCLDVELQESLLSDPSARRFPNTERYLKTIHPPGAPMDDVVRVVAQLEASQRPLFLFGRVDRSKKSWDERVALAERYGALVITDLKQAVAFPTQHKLHACPPGVFISPKTCKVIEQADLIISFDWVDLAGTLKAVGFPNAEPSSHIIHITLDSSLHNGWSQDHFGLPPIDHAIAADVNNVISTLLAVPSRESTPRCRDPWRLQFDDQPNGVEGNHGQDDDIYMSQLAEAVYEVIDSEKTCLVRLPLGWKGRDLRATHPLAYLGGDGGAGLGSGPGQAVGAALALKDTDYLPLAILGDGDYLMGSSALWTAARYRLPLLVIVANNASFFNDEVHQERVAKVRNRPIENKGIGIRIDNPQPDISQNAASLGAVVIGGRVTKHHTLVERLKEAVREVQNKKTVVVVDVQVRPDGYSLG
jgi:thiamine pyrophosphate-dependent acetolactate synthase large subunit-like protein